jgi:hypothetical protein
MGSFADSIKANIKELQQEVNDKIVDVFVETSLSVVHLTPSPSWIGQTRGASPSSPQYTDGLLANQWYPAENKISNEETSAESDNGGDSITRINAMKSVKTFVAKDGYLSLTNNVPYAYRVDAVGYPAGRADVIQGYGNWSWWNGSHEKPYAMIDTSIAKIKAKIG